MFLESMCYLDGTLSTEKHCFHKYHSFLPPANEVCEGYVFTRVCHSVHGGGRVVSQHALQVSRPTPKGKVEGSGWGGGSPGPHLGGGGACCRGVPTLGGGGLPAMATAAGGTHPTGMHSCLCVCTLGPIH